MEVRGYVIRVKVEIHFIWRFVYGGETSNLKVKLMRFVKN